jgi:catechol 2,3-dioxygenase-like lactoylglutathione lyase family enzyme
MQVKSIDHIHIYSVDPYASLAFWERHFGARKVFETKNVHHQAVHITQLGGQGVAFSEYPPGMAPERAVATSPASGREGLGLGGVMHLGINVADVRSAVAELQAAGVTVHSEPAEAYGTTFAYVEAPDGVLIELTQY